MPVYVAINGTGRIGMSSARIIGSREDVELTALNTTTDIDTLVHLMRYDTVHKSFDVEKIDAETIRVGNSKRVRVFSNRNPQKVPFGETGARVVLECTGVFKGGGDADLHLHGGVEKVVISAPADGTTPTYVMGVNHTRYEGEPIISNASCTTNCLGPIAKVLHERFGIRVGMMTTVHSYTNDQNLLDVKHKDIRRARAAAQNMIPTSTGAAKAIGLVMPELEGRLNGFAIRVPTPDVSVVDLSLELEREATKESINAAMEEASAGELAPYLHIDHHKRVSSDFIGSPYSAIFVPDFTMVIGAHHAKILAWYDNEWGYSNRLVDMATYIGGR